MSSGVRFIHARHTVHETLEGEAIVIHLETGSYYSLTGAGAEIWGLVGGGSSVSQICADLAERYGRPEGEIRGEVERFMVDLQREDLVEDGEVSPNGLPASPDDLRAAPIDGDGAWAPPKLERYDDMRDFLLVDPVHEVDDTGWPSRQASS